MKKMTNNRGGFLKTIIVIIIALALLKFIFNFDVIEFLKSPKAEETIRYIVNIIKIVWNDYLSVPLIWLWNAILGLVAKYR